MAQQDARSGATFRKLSREEVLDRQLASVAKESGTYSPDVQTPMPGTVISVQVSDGQQVSAGQVLAIVEAMKMEHQLLAPVDESSSLRYRQEIWSRPNR